MHDEEKLFEDLGSQFLPLNESQLFVGRWNRLVSSTNWEKGKIIVAWREKISESSVDPALYSDETWSRLVGDVTAQHVGRLRRTYLRFGKMHREYAGLYWSHFYAALDWNDAEMWLEGAVQNKWSVSQMRRMRWGATHGSERAGPGPEDIVSAEFADGLGLLDLSRGEIRSNSHEVIDGPIYEAVAGQGISHAAPTAPEPRRDSSTRAERDPDGPFAVWEDLPDDLAKVVEDFKVIALRYKLGNWSEFAQEKLVRVLESLIYLVNAPK